METALDVLSHAATIVQDNANESRAKELPTAKWRRDRRMRTGEYHAGIGQTAGGAATATATAISPGGGLSTQHGVSHAHAHHLSGSAQHLNHHHQQHAHALTSPPAHMSMMLAAAASMRPLSESTNRPPGMANSPPIDTLDYAHHQQQLAMETPLDMSVSSITMKQRASPPPPYREPLPGSTYATTLARPSVITQAPPKRNSRDSILLSNRENDNYSSDSQSMCETVIDEHFRRSLGPDYVALFGKKSPAPTTTPSPQPQSYVLSAPATPQPQPQPAHNATAQLIAAAAAAAAVLPGAAQPQAPPPAYHLSPQALISPKSANLLLQAQAIKSQSNSPQPQYMTGLPPPQEQPLALQRTPSTAAINAAQLYAHNSNSTTRPTTPNSPDTLSAASTSPRPTPDASPALPHTATNGNAANLHSPNSNSHKTGGNNNNFEQQPAYAQMKREASGGQLQHAHPNSNTNSSTYSNNNSNSNSAANTPPHSPQTAAAMLLHSTGATTATTTAAAVTTNVRVKVDAGVPSVDDHFEKALGDTWKKLQQEHKK